MFGVKMKNATEIHLALILIASHYKSSWIERMITHHFSEVYLSMSNLHGKYSKTQIEVLNEMKYRVEVISEKLPYPLFNWGSYVNFMNRALLKDIKKDPFFTGSQDTMLEVSYVHYYAPINLN
jgi:hypothetical protein